MNLSFTIGDIPLDKNEVSALFSMADKPPAISVDITRHVDRTLIDAKKLFNLSVEQRNPQLASLAAKLAIYKPVASRRTYTRTGSQKIGQQPVTPLSVDEALNLMLANQNLKTTGAAMLLFMCESGKQATLKETACVVVNLLSRLGLPENSDYFRGFRRGSESGQIEVVTKAPGLSRAELYHASPMYTALRDGLALLVRSGLATLEERTTFGSDSKELSVQSQLLRRKVYYVSLTRTGLEVTSLWEDITDYIFNFWSKRAA
jgi:hypothetical protein